MVNLFFKGIFHFRFWRFGKWYSVVIDDRLPCYSDKRLIFSSNKKQPNEFWICLLEKGILLCQLKVFFKLFNLKLNLFGQAYAK